MRPTIASIQPPRASWLRGCGGRRRWITLFVGRTFMRILLAVTMIVAAALAWGCPVAKGGDEFPTLEERVDEARWIVVGTFMGNQTGFPHVYRRGIVPLFTLKGLLPTNAVVTVDYNARITEPGTIGTPSKPLETKVWIMFLTESEQSPKEPGHFRLRAIGQQRRSDDAFDLATEESLKKVREAVDKLGKRRGTNSPAGTASER